ncbi:hypothetical protein AAVH_24901, partial [Aphelenchoides avenae]
MEGMLNVPCTERFLKKYYAYSGSVPEDSNSWFTKFTEYVSGGYDYVNNVPLYRARKKIDSFGMKIFCWNCFFVNAVLLVFLLVRYIMMEFVYRVSDVCFYYLLPQNQKIPAIIPVQDLPHLWEWPIITDDVGRWSVYSMALSFLLLRYTTYRACVSPLSFRNSFGKVWWSVAILTA